MKLADQIIRCGTHGEASRALVCGHLFGQARQTSFVPLKYYSGNDDDSGPDATETPCVWCAACDDVLQREGDWNDTSEAFADIHLVCEFCLADILVRNIPGEL